MKILVVEDNRMDQAIIETNLSDHELIIVDSGEDGLKAAEQKPDIVLMDINLPGMDGYETCKALRELDATRNTPVIFLTTLSGLEDRIKAFDVGGNDHIAKPCDPRILKSKVDFYAEFIRKLESSAAETQSAVAALLDVQAQSAKIQSISRFVQGSLFCHDIDSLFNLFMKTAREIGANCVLQINSEAGPEMRSTHGNISVLEREIIEHSENARRIHTFGQGRAIFKWGHATLLTLQVGDLIDILAIFMDALEAGIKAIDAESQLLVQVKGVEAENSRVRDEISDVFDRMSNELKETILSLGIVEALDPNEEDRLNDMVNEYSAAIHAKLATLQNNNAEIQRLINELRTPPEELQGITDAAEDNDIGGGIDFF